MNSSRKPLMIALLFVALVLVNYLAFHVPFRGDVTADHIYTLSPGSHALLGKVDEPVTLDFYFSRSSDLPVELKDYADRVQEMLRQYVRASHGKVTLHVVDPEPDTPEEEQATKNGVEPQRVRTGAEPFYFGLVATQADKQKAIATLTPDREQFLEYDISELIYNVQQLDKKKLGLITSLPLQGTPGNPMMQQQGTEGQYVVTEWQDTFDIVPVEATATELPAKLDALAVVHPENLTPKLQYAIDQFLLSGKPVFMAVDPSSTYFKRQGGEQAMMMGGAQPNVSSDLPVLFKGWGVVYNPTKVIGDNALAQEVSLPNGGTARYPIWISFGAANFNSKALPTAQLNSMMVVESGSVSLRAGSPLSLTPLVETSASGGEIDASALQFAQPDDVARQLTPSGKKVVAALITGKFTSAFPDGAPKDEPAAADADKKDDANKPKPAPAKEAPALKTSTGTSTLLIVADTDWLFDDYSIRKFSMLGQTAAEPLNDNLSFAANSLDFLAGSEDLISIRGKGSALRPFVVVKQMQAAANEKYEQQLGALETELTNVQSKLTELQGKKSEGNHLVASPEVTKTIQEFQAKQAGLRSQRRAIRLQLRKGIDRLEYTLLALDALVVPVLLIGFGVWYFQRRR